MQIAEAVGLPAAQTWKRAFAAEIINLTETLLLAPVAKPADLIRKLVTLAAMTEPGPTDAAAFPGRHLRTLLADVVQLYGPASADSLPGPNAGRRPLPGVSGRRQ